MPRTRQVRLLYDRCYEAGVEPPELWDLSDWELEELFEWAEEADTDEIRAAFADEPGSIFDER